MSVANYKYSIYFSVTPRLYTSVRLLSCLSAVVHEATDDLGEFERLPVSTAGLNSPPTVQTDVVFK